ncbi:hypothetical protein JCM8547_008826 [Rhodosporidiobolus lusitaniae]
MKQLRRIVGLPSSSASRCKSTTAAARRRAAASEKKGGGDGEKKGGGGEAGEGGEGAKEGGGEAPPPPAEGYVAGAPPPAEGGGQAPPPAEGEATPAGETPPPAASGAPADGNNTELVAGAGQVVVSPLMVPFNMQVPSSKSVEFIWALGVPHTVTQSSALTICNATKEAGAFKSGKLQKGLTFPVEVKDDTKPIWYYCTVKDYCLKGMFARAGRPQHADEDPKKQFGGKMEELGKQDKANQVLIDATISITANSDPRIKPWGEKFDYYAAAPQLLASFPPSSTSNTSASASESGSSSLASTASAAAQASSSGGGGGEIFSGAERGSTPSFAAVVSVGVVVLLVGVAQRALSGFELGREEEGKEESGLGSRVDQEEGEEEVAYLHPVRRQRRTSMSSPFDFLISPTSLPLIMLLEQDFRWGDAQLVGNTCLVYLTMPENKPSIFRGGLWRAGWTDISPDKSRLTLTGSGVRTPVDLSVYVFRSPTRTASRSFRRPWGNCRFPTELSGSFMSDAGWMAPLLFLRLELDVAGASGEARKRPCNSRASTASQLRKAFEGSSQVPFSAGPSAFDVRLTFPRANRQIWTSQAILSQYPYFATLFSSDFAEGVKSDSNSPCSGNDPFFGDSDDETVGAIPKLPSSALSPSQLPPHKTVRITEASYSTYLAVVTWKQCGQIEFAPLTSSFFASSSSDTNASSNRTASTVPPDFPPPSPFWLPPVSPKSVYRLAHLLELSSLSILALVNFRSQLRADTVARELFSHTLSCYDELRSAALDFALANLKEVLASPALKDAQARAEGEEGEGWETRIWAELAMRMGKWLVGGS